MQKCMVAKVPFLLLFLNCDLTMFYNDISKMVWILMHHHFSTKLMLITARSSVTTQRLRSFKFSLISKSHSQHSEAAVHCIRHHFLILYACIYIVLFPDQSTRQLVWEQGWCIHKWNHELTSTGSRQYAQVAWCFPVIVGWTPCT